MTDTAEEAQPGEAPDQVTIGSSGTTITCGGDGQTSESAAVTPSRKPRPQRNHGNLGRYIQKALQVVVENYNKSRDQHTTQELKVSDVYIVWFSKTLRNWKAIVGSPVVYGLLWEVSCDGGRQEIYIDVYKKVTNVSVPVRGKK